MPLLVLAHFCHHLISTTLVPLSPFIREDFALDYTQAGLLISAFSISSGLANLPGGWLADRIGPRILLTIGICGVALAGLIVGLSQSYIMIIIFLVLMGVAGGGYHPATPPLISSVVGAQNRGQALGLHAIGGSLSYLLGPLIAAAIAAAWGWRGSFIGLAVPTIIFGIILYVLFGRQATTIKATPKAESKPTGSYSETAPTPGYRRRLASFIILSTGTSAIMMSVLSFVPLFAIHHLGIAKEAAAALMAIRSLPGLWVAPVGGYLSDRFGRVPVMMVICLLAGPLIYLMTLMPSVFSMGVVLFSIGIIVATRMPVSEAYIIGQAPEHRRSTILGIYFFAGAEGSGIITPVLGYLIDKFDFYISFTIAGAAMMAITIICSLLLWRSQD